MTSIISFLFRQPRESNDNTGASLKTEKPSGYSTIEGEVASQARQRGLAIQGPIDEKSVVRSSHVIARVESPKMITRAEFDEKYVAAYRPRPISNRKVSSAGNGGLLIELRKGQVSKQKSSALLGARVSIAASGSFSSDLQPNERVPLVGHRIGKKISTRIYRVADEHIPNCQNLVDNAFASDPLCQYLRGPTITGKGSFALMQKYHKKSQELALRRATVKGDIAVRAAVISSETVSETDASSAAPQVVQEIEPCAGFALWRVSSPGTMYSWDLLLFDLRTAHTRLIAMLDELYCGLKDGHLYSLEGHIPGGVVDESRYSVYMRSREKVVKKLLNGRRYLTVQNLGVLAEFRNEGIGSQLLQYGLDMADTQNLPIYIETGSAKFLKFCEKSQFKLVHELRLFDLQHGKLNVGNKSIPIETDADERDSRRDFLASAVVGSPTSNRTRDETGNSSKHIPKSCSVYCLIREPAVKKLAPLPVLPGNAGAKSA
ncbi:hypothetical protein V1517DRAFT_316191 [Lipomyces orientalis]|uniref:Uncharacterized protein n=1 Tax=Lipomyces orientalis TaxID=1233043 RepID=A0ACC3TUC0_9ASCO